ncbi:MAG: hypothetical protein GTN39_03065 [Candidatus Aenigmarchaeota archaeon]|nr:hypothetical protein [Candidatus Aenigmarchaeota archaeon]
MKGQFFLASAFALAILFFIGISSQITPGSVVTAETTSLELLSDNVKSEYPKVANLGLNESDPVRILMNFTEFVERKTRERGAEFSFLFVLTQNVSDDLNVTVGNYIGYTVNIELNVSGDSETLSVPDMGTDSELFSNPPESFELEISFNTTEKNLLLEKRKANFYFILEMRKGGNIIKEEVKS